MNRTPLPEHRIAAIRRERYAPQFTQWDYLHLRSLKEGLETVFRSLAPSPGPALDLYCGTQPYRELIPWRPLWGVDMDLRYRRADVLAHGALPFRDGTFAIVICTQALQQVYDAEQTVAEMYRITAPAGYAVASVPYLFVREFPWERRYTEESLRELFSAWTSVDIYRTGGTGTGTAYCAGRLLHGLARRSSVTSRVMPKLAVPLNLAGMTIDRVTVPFGSRWPAHFIVVARR